MGQIFVTSDLHFCHNQNFLYTPRGFQDVQEMNKMIISNWNSVVMPEDDVYVLGDIMLNDNIEGLRCLKSLKGNIHIIRGNHDSDSRMDLYRSCYNVIEVCDGKFLRYGDYHFYLSHYPCFCSNFDDNKPLTRRMISLCGHSHTKNQYQDMDKGLIYHCELDCQNNTPILIDDIIIDIQNYLDLAKQKEII